jgi:hypothetical protein
MAAALDKVECKIAVRQAGSSAGVRSAMAIRDGNSARWHGRFKVLELRFGGNVCRTNRIHGKIALAPRQGLVPAPGTGRIIYSLFDGGVCGHERALGVGGVVGDVLRRRLGGVLSHRRF